MEPYITSNFIHYNETELDIFKRQSGFTFSDCHLSPDGTVLAIDRSSSLIFIGKDLLKCNLHSFTSLVSAEVEGEGLVHIVFGNSTDIHFVTETDEAESLASELSGLIEVTPTEETGHEPVSEEPGCEEPASEEEPETNDKEDIPQETNPCMAEVYSILLNSGRANAIKYLITELGMSAREASEYVEKIGSPAEDGEVTARQELPPVNGPMSKEAVISVIKQLKARDRIHIEYKPFIGKLKVFDAEYNGLEIYLAEKYHKRMSGEDYKSLMEDVIDRLFDEVHILFITDTGCEAIRPLNQVKVLRKI